MTDLAPAMHAEAVLEGAAAGQSRTSLVDLLDRLLGAGVVLSGDVTLSLAGVDLVTVKLRALVATVRDAS